MTHTPHKPGGCSGFAMIEAMIGIVVMTIALAGLSSVATHVTRQRVEDRDLAAAFSACRDVMEQVRSLPLAALPALDTQGFAVPGVAGPGSDLRPIDGDPDGLPGEIAVTIEEQTIAATLYRVEARVTWQGVRGRRDLSLTGLVGGRQ